VTTVPGGGAGRVVVEVRGEVDAATAPLLQACLDSQSASAGLRELVVDLRGATSLDGAGAAALTRARRRCAARGARLVLRGSGAHVPLPGGGRGTARSGRQVHAAPAGRRQQPGR
jgi:anti-anti-sigma factor